MTYKSLLWPTVLFCFFIAPLSFAHAEIRNGWFYNFTPGNMTLIDRDGEWIIGVQGGFQAEWQVEVDLTANEDESVLINGPHGYSCVSIDVTLDKKSKHILVIKEAKQLLLKKCLEDLDIPAH